MEASIDDTTIAALHYHLCAGQLSRCTTRASYCKGSIHGRVVAVGCARLVGWIHAALSTFEADVVAAGGVTAQQLDLDAQISYSVLVGFDTNDVRHLGYRMLHPSGTRLLARRSRRIRVVAQWPAAIETRCNCSAMSYHVGF
jgi:hypothetical protein